MRLQVIFPQSITFSTSNIGRKLTQSTLHMGSDTQTQSICKSKVCFNPRSHMGSDQLCESEGIVDDKVSIHAPTWGATLKSLPIILALKFQSTLPHGERHILLIANVILISVSIHAPTWGATWIAQSASMSICFNPRSHMGSDGDYLTTEQSPRVSIHAPTWGATYLFHLFDKV